MYGESHTLFGCQQFKQLLVDDRIGFVERDKLCFNCLSPGHLSFSCSLGRRCTVNGCGKCHTKFLHVGNSPQPSAGREQSTVMQQASAASMCHIRGKQRHGGRWQCECSTGTACSGQKPPHDG